MSGTGSDTGRVLEDARVDAGQQPGQPGELAGPPRAQSAQRVEVLLERQPLGRRQGPEDVGAVLVREVAAHAVTPISSSASRSARSA